MEGFDKLRRIEPVISINSIRRKSTRWKGRMEGWKKYLPSIPSILPLFLPIKWIQKTNFNIES